MLYPCSHAYVPGFSAWFSASNIKYLFTLFACESDLFFMYILVSRVHIETDFQVVISRLFHIQTHNT